MLLEFLTYDLKVAVLIAVFYMFYRLMLARETFHRVNRIVLLLTALASYLLPLCVITMHRTVKMEGLPMVTLDDLQMDAVIAESVAETPLWQILLSTLFIIGMVVTLGHTLMSMFRILMLIKRCEKHLQSDGITICVTENTQIAPFSWMHYIVMNRNDYEVSDSAILAHERGHIHLHHSWDLLLVDTLTALQWFNPAMWMLRSDLRAIHEYEADGAVLSQGINARQYQYLLITKAGGIGGYSLANGINHSTLKNRITMMTNKTSKNSHLLKLLALVPIIGITLAINAETVTDVVYSLPQQQQPVKKGAKKGVVKTGTQNIKVVEDKALPEKKDIKTNAKTEKSDDEKNLYINVETMPEFPGGVEALMEYLAKNVKYPKEAAEKGIQGRVVCSFIVENDGSISDAKIMRSVDPSLDEEALRVVNSMPNWTPGMQDGKPVRVRYTIPISFKLDGKKENALDNIPKDVDVEVDGKLVEPEVLKMLQSGEIDRITIEKAKDNGERSKIVITTKKVK